MLIILTAVSLTWGTLMKSIIYQHFRKIKISEKPINLLILMDQVYPTASVLLLSRNFFKQFVIPQSLKKLGMSKPLTKVLTAIFLKINSQINVKEVILGHLSESFIDTLTVSVTLAALHWLINHALGH